MEITLDVEWAHAIAPGRRSMLVEAGSATMSSLLSAVNFAASHGANEVSMSWGGERIRRRGRPRRAFNHPGVAFTASSGDGGAGSQLSIGLALCDDRRRHDVVASSAGTRLAETAWSGSGGGISAGETLPAYQAGFVSGQARGAPDVSYNADPSTGVYVYATSPGYGGWYEVGGTSAGAPQWAGIFALVNQGRACARQVRARHRPGRSASTPPLLQARRRFLVYECQWRLLRRHLRQQRDRRDDGLRPRHRPGQPRREQADPGSDQRLSRTHHDQPVGINRQPRPIDKCLRLRVSSADSRWQQPRSARVGPMSATATVRAVNGESRRISASFAAGRLGRLQRHRAIRSTFMLEGHRQFGDVFRFQIGPLVFHQLAHPDHVKHVLLDQRRTTRGAGITAARRWWARGW